MSIAMMAQVWSHTPVRDGREIVGLLALADWADDYGGAYPAYDVLAHKMRCSERQAMRVIAALSEAGEVYRLPEKARRKAFFNSNLFVVLSGCKDEADIQERIYKSAKGKGIRIKRTEIPASDLAKKRSDYSAEHPLLPPPNSNLEGDTYDTLINKGGDVHDTPKGDTYDTHDLTRMSPNTSLIRHIDTSINGGGNSSLASDNPLPSPLPTAAAVSVNLSPLVAVLVEINEGLADPFTGVEDLARTLYRNEKTPDEVRHLWNAMQYRRNPAGAFIDAIKRNYTPKTKPVPKPPTSPQDGETRTVHGVKQVFKRGRWYDAHKVSGRNE